MYLYFEEDATTSQNFNKTSTSSKKIIFPWYNKAQLPPIIVLIDILDKLATNTGSGDEKKKALFDGGLH